MDFGSIATAIITVVGLIIYAVNQVVEVQKMNTPTAPPRGGQGQRQGDPLGNPNANRPRPAQRGEDVDNFLRDVASRRDSGAPPHRRPAPPRQEPPRQEPPRRRPTADAGSSSSASSSPVGSLSQQHTIEDRARQFASRVSGDVSTDDVVPTIDRHIQSTFSNQVGTIAQQGSSLAGAESAATMAGGGATRDSASPLAMELRALLSNPRSLQQAVLLQEILQRPTQRW